MKEINKIIQGDALDVLKTLPNESVDCIITSPPYWALRDYGVSGQFGLEKTYQEYVNKLCDIFDEIKRVLKNEGTCWVNIGDMYDKNKNLLQIPSRFSIEMASRGWILRNEIIWHKPNCMPQSVTDRFTMDYEKVFFFTKNKKYLFEQQTEKAIWAEDPRAGFGRLHYRGKREGQKGTGQENFVSIKQFRNVRSIWKIPTKKFKEAHFATYPEKLIEPMIKAGCPMGGVILDPFFGAGTTGIAALKLNRKYLGIELNPEYVKIAEDRISNII